MGSETEATLAAAVGPGAAPAPSPHAAAVEVDGETVVYHERTGGLHLLNPTATLIWWSLDGETTLDELASELAEAAGADPSQVGADVVEATRDFARLGLLDLDPDSETGMTGEADSDDAGFSDHGGQGGAASDAAGDEGGGTEPRPVPAAGST